MKSLLAVLTSASVLLVGCSTASKDIAPISASPLQYNAYDCSQLVAENVRLNGRMSQLSGRLDEAASNDKAITGAGIILFWPALFALGGTKQQEAEYAKLKGEHDALQQSLILKKCEISPTPSVAASEAKAPDAQPTSGVAAPQK